MIILHYAAQIDIQIRFLWRVSVAGYRFPRLLLSFFLFQAAWAHQKGPDVPQTITLRCRNAALDWCPPYIKSFFTGAKHDLWQDWFLIGTSGFESLQQKMAVGGIGITFAWCEKWQWGESTFLMSQNLPHLLFQPYHCWSHLSNPCCYLKTFLIWQACHMTPRRNTKQKTHPCSINLIYLILLDI